MNFNENDLNNHFVKSSKFNFKNIFQNGYIFLCINVNFPNICNL